MSEGNDTRFLIQLDLKFIKRGRVGTETDTRRRVPREKRAPCKPSTVLTIVGGSRPAGKQHYCRSRGPVVDTWCGIPSQLSHLSLLQALSAKRATRDPGRVDVHQQGGHGHPVWLHTSHTRTER